jgi:hypothetical protein
VRAAYQFHQNVPFLLRELRHGSTPLSPTAASRYPSKSSKMQAVRACGRRRAYTAIPDASVRCATPQAVRIALGACFVLYVMVAIASATAFGASVHKNLLVSLSSAHGLQLLPPSLVVSVQGAMSLVMVFVFPVNSYGLRVGLHAMLRGGERETAMQRWAGAAMLTAVCFGVAAVVNDLGVLFSIIGATVGTTGCSHT